MSKKMVKGILATAVAATVLTGCVGGDKGTTQKADENAKVTIKYWNFPNFVNDKEFPKTKITMQL